MKIAVLGANGTIGNFIYKVLSQRYNVIGITRQVVDLSNTLETYNYFASHSFDVVINSVVNPDSRMTADITVARDNFTTFTNIYSMRHMFGRVIHFASGAEFDRSKPITEASEDEIFQNLPIDPYGMSKNVTSRLANITNNWYVLRLFGVFHPTESLSRLLPKVLFNSPIVLEDKYFDYIYLEDLLPVIEFYINETPVYKDINLVYSEKMLLSSFVRHFCEIHQLSSDNITYGNFSELSYTGNGDKWKSLNLPILGTTIGLSRYKGLSSDSI